MEQIRNFSSSTQAGRWIWELLQNAKDCAYPTQPVHIKLELYDDKVVFSHNGRSFGVEHLLALVNQVSSKTEEHTGKFGTGFLMTHLLSEKVLLSSVIQDFDTVTGARLPMKSFNLELDRSGVTKEDMLQSLRHTINIIRHLDERPEVEVDFEDYNTSFTYPLQNEVSKKIVRLGVKELEQSACYVLAFVPEIGDIHIIDHAKKFTREMKRTPVKTWENEQISTFTMLVKETGILKNQIILVAKKDNVSIAMPFSEAKKCFLPIPSFLPRIFADFPLLDSQSYPIPAVCHSSDFKCNPQRTNIPVIDSEISEDSETNKKLLEQFIELYGIVLKEASKSGFGDFFYATTYREIPVRYDLDKQWIISNVYDKIHFYLQTIPMFTTEEGLCNLHEQLMLPKGENEEEIARLWKLLEMLDGIDLPRLNDLKGWYASFECYDHLVKEFYVTLDYVAKYAAEIPLQLQSSRLRFAQMVYDAVLLQPQLRSELISGKFALFPDQSSHMSLHTALDIYQDPGIDESIKQAILQLNCIEMEEDDVTYPIYQMLLLPTFKIGDIVLPTAPMDEILQYVSLKSDLHLPVANYETEHLIYEKRRNTAVGFLASCYPDDYWLKLYKQFVNPSFLTEHQPSVFATKELWYHSIMMIYEKSVEVLTEHKTVEELRFAHFLDETRETALDFLNEFFAKSLEMTDAIYNNSLFPNQHDVFFEAKALCKDKGIDETLKELCLLLKNEGVSDYTQFLLLPEIEGVSLDFLPVKENIHLAHDISRGINTILNHKDMSDVDDSTQEACTLFLAWLSDNGELAEELFPQFYSFESQMKLITPKAVAHLQAKMLHVQEVLKSNNLSDVAALEELLELVKTRGLEPAAPDFIFDDDDVYVDFSEFEELEQYTKDEQKSYAVRLTNTALNMAMDRLIKKWIALGFLVEEQDDEEKVILVNLENRVTLHQPAPSPFKKTGWNISEMVNDTPPIYYAVKSTVSNVQCEAVELTRAQTDFAFLMGENFRILRYHLSMDLKNVITCTQITDLLGDLKSDQLRYSGQKLQLKMNKPAF